MIGNQVGGVVGGVGVRVLSTVVITLPLLSCRSFYGPCVGSASVNNVDHPRADLYFRRQPARRDFRILLARYLARYLRFSRYLLRSAVPVPVAGLVVCGHPVPPSLQRDDDEGLCKKVVKKSPILVLESPKLNAPRVAVTVSGCIPDHGQELRIHYID